LTSFEILGRHLEYRWIGPHPGDAPSIVFLHEGLGCMGTWWGFPDRLASATGCGALVYSRIGYGGSDSLIGKRPIRYMHDEALGVLPAVLEHFKLEKVLLFGHSDGASIALIHAGAHSNSVLGLIVEAPHVFVESISIEGIERITAEYGTTRLKERLARYHGSNTDSMFRGWSDVWLSPGFRKWNIEEYLPAIECPVLVVQGENDQYGTLKQVDAVVAQVGGSVESLVLPRCGHSPHSERPDEVLEAATLFVRKAFETGHEFA
jgi:pimeloyl-ACP methyl ester carboxylesterase